MRKYSNLNRNLPRTLKGESTYYDRNCGLFATANEDMVAIEGRIQRFGLGAATWVLITPHGQSYEILKGAPEALLRAGMQVRVWGEVREDLPVIGVSGSVIEVRSFELALP